MRILEIAAEVKMSALFCSFCDYRCHRDGFLLKHLRDFHANDPNFQVNCTLCGKSYKKWCSLKKHLHRVHSGENNLSDILVFKCYV